MRHFTKIFLLAVLLIVSTAGNAFAANSLDVNANAALQGSFGLEVLIDGADNLGEAYVVSDHPVTETTYNFKFLIDPTNLTAAAERFFIMGSIKKTDPPVRNFLLIYLRRSGNGQFWEIQSNVRDDSNSFQAWQAPIKICGDAGTAIPCTSVAPVEFEFQWQAASAPGANDGSLRILKNGTVRVEFLNIDNDAQTIDEALFGAIFMSNATQGNAAGSYYFDEFVSTR